MTIRKFIQEHVPAPIVKPLQREVVRYWQREPIMHKMFPRFEVEFKPFDELFGHVEKMWQTDPVTVPTPAAASLPFSDQARPLQNDTYVIPEDYVALIPGALYTATNDMAAAPARKIISESSNLGPVDNIFARELYHRHPTFIPGYATLLRSRDHNYYHAIVDDLPRLMAIAASPYAEKEVKLLCTTPPSRFETFFLDKLGLSNLRVTVVNRRTLYRVENLVFTPFKTRRFSGYWPQSYIEHFRRSVLPERPSAQSHRILISRQKAERRRINNWQALTSTLSELGFEELVAERLTLEEQIEVFYDAECVVGAHGAGLTNMLYSPSLKVVELFPTPCMVPHYYFMSLGLGHDYRYWCGNEKGITKVIPRFSVNIDAVVDRLAEIGVT